MKKTEKPTSIKGKNGGARPGAGRKKFEPTPKERVLVKSMAGYGVPFEQIASMVRDGIHIDTLRAHFSNELTTGKALANAKIGEGLYKKALSGDTTAMIWWTKAQMGWREPPRQIEDAREALREERRNDPTPQEIEELRSRYEMLAGRHQSPDVNI